MKNCSLFHGIDLSSDTVTRPTAAMRQAMARAEVGDEQKGEDPTTLQLEEKAAELLGHSAAMFFPSATMANEVAILLHCQPGDELIAAENAHLFFAEAGGPAVHAGVMTRPIATDTGIFTGEDINRVVRWMKGPHFPPTKLVSVENTTNLGGGMPWPAPALESVLTAAKKLGLKTHLDGSRLMNAVVATQRKTRDIAGPFDTVTLCLSKGLGCPMGALLAFDQAWTPLVRRLKQRMGGAMRQSGILAAAGLYALEHHVLRLYDDHAHAQQFAHGIAACSPLSIINDPPQTNMIFFRWMNEKIPAPSFAEKCLARGLRFQQSGERVFRAVTHLDVEREDIEQAIAIVKEVCQSC